MAGNPRARAIVLKAIEQGMSYDEIAELCEVSEGSVRRWVSSGRANAKTIEPLVKKVGTIQLTPQDLGNTCIEIYKKRKKRFFLERDQLMKLAGRAITLRWIDQLSKYLDGQGYLFKELINTKGDTTIFAMISHKQIARYAKYSVEEEEIEDFYIEMEEPFEDE